MYVTHGLLINVQPFVGFIHEKVYVDVQIIWIDGH